MKAKTFLGLTLFAALLCLLPGAAFSGERPDLDRQVTALERAVATLQTTVSTLQGQVAALQTANTAQQATITSLQNTVTTQQTTITGLQGTVSGLSSSVSTLQTGLTSVQTAVGAVQGNSVLALGPYLTVNPSTKLVLLQGVNLQLVNGTGATASSNGLGNLILGYNVPRNDEIYFCSNGQYTDLTDCTTNGGTWAVSLKSGSHYLVIGDYNNYSQYGGLVVGMYNTSNNAYASVSGGNLNTASGVLASVSGGAVNTASGVTASVSGGYSHSATGTYNWAAGTYASSQ